MSGRIIAAAQFPLYTRHDAAPARGWVPLPRNQQRIADNVCGQLHGRTRHRVSAADLMIRAQRAVGELGQSISTESLAEMACLLIAARLDLAARQ